MASSTGLFRQFFAALAIGLLSLGALVALAMPATAGPPDPAACLELDRIGHELSLNGAEPALTCALAFEKRAMQHDLFNGDHFGFGRVDIRT